jgi:hypothetical protein
MNCGVSYKNFSLLFTTRNNFMAQKNESPFVGLIESIIRINLPDHLEIKRGELLVYHSAFDTKSEFETDLCIFDGVKPRVVFELKTAPTTHDVMVYSHKAEDHKREIPYIVYGMVAERGNAVPTKLLKHNRHMDFALYLGGMSEPDISLAIKYWIHQFIDESLLRERISGGKVDSKRGFFRKTICQ